MKKNSCLYLIQNWEDEFECIHPVNVDKEEPLKFNKDGNCPWFEKSPYVPL